MDPSSASAQAKANLGLIADTRGLNKLRELGNGSKKEQAQALYAAAQQFESLLMQYWVDGMRATNDELNPDSPLKSKYSGFFDDMLAQQQVSAMVQGNGVSGASGIGINKSSITYLITKQFASSLGDAGKELMAQLEGRATDEKAPVGQLESTDKGPRFFELRASDPRVPVLQKPSQLMAQAKNHNASISSLSQMYADLPDARSMRNFSSPEDFVEKMMPYAVKAVEGMSMNPLVLVAQAALETGWGKHVPSGNNYYGIKAGGSWQGQVQNMDSPEFENGRMVTRNSAFRAYSSVLESMKDYINLIKGNERYSKAASSSFDPDTYFEEIQRAGYATDPNYANKLKDIVRKIAFMAYKQHTFQSTKRKKVESTSFMILVCHELSKTPRTGS